MGLADKKFKESHWGYRLLEERRLSLQFFFIFIKKFLPNPLYKWSALLKNSLHQTFSNSRSLLPFDSLKLSISQILVLSNLPNYLYFFKFFLKFDYFSDSLLWDDIIFV